MTAANVGRADCVLTVVLLGHAVWCADVLRPALLGLVPAFLVCWTDIAVILHRSKSRLSLTSRSAVALFMLQASKRTIGDVFCPDITAGTE